MGLIIISRQRSSIPKKVLPCFRRHTENAPTGNAWRASHLKLLKNQLHTVFSWCQHHICTCPPLTSILLTLPSSEPTYTDSPTATIGALISEFPKVCEERTLWSEERPSPLDISSRVKRPFLAATTNPLGTRTGGDTMESPASNFHCRMPSVSRA